MSDGDGARSNNVFLGNIVVRRTSDRDFRITAEGSWMLDYLERNFEQFSASLHAARQAGVTIRILVDLRQAAVQQAATAERIKVWAERLYKEGDRIAIIVSSMLVKMQMRRVVALSDCGIFTTEEEANDWLAQPSS